MTTVVNGKPKCERCRTGIGWTRYIRCAHAGKPIWCWTCVFVARVRGV